MHHYISYDYAQTNIVHAPYRLLWSVSRHNLRYHSAIETRRLQGLKHSGIYTTTHPIFRISSRSGLIVARYHAYYMSPGHAHSSTYDQSGEWREDTISNEACPGEIITRQAETCSAEQLPSKNKSYCVEILYAKKNKKN